MAALSNFQVGLGVGAPPTITDFNIYGGLNDVYVALNSLVQQLNSGTAAFAAASFTSNNDAYGFFSNPLTTAGNPGYRINNLAGSRTFELLYLGPTSGGGYGAPANSVSLNSSNIPVGMYFSTNDIQAMKIDNNQSVMIGFGATTTLSSAVKLMVGHVGNAANSYGGMIVGDPATPASTTGIYLRSTVGAGINVASGSYLQFGVLAGAEWARFDSSGNFGIGQVPSVVGVGTNLLTLGKNVGGGDIILRVENQNSVGVVSSTVHLGYGGADFYGYRLTNLNNPGATGAGLFKIQRGTVVAWIDALSIDNSGYFGLNCTPVGAVAIRIQDPANNDVGLEWVRASATAGNLQSYNRAGAAYTFLNIDCSDISLRIGGVATTSLRLSSGGVLLLTTSNYQQWGDGVYLAFAGKGTALDASAAAADFCIRWDAGILRLSPGGVTSLSVSTTAITSSLPITTKGYTVATLPAGTQGMIAHVTDALAPAFLTAVVGGGAVKSLVFYNGATWVAA